MMGVTAVADVMISVATLTHMGGGGGGAITWSALGGCR